MAFSASSERTFKHRLEVTIPARQPRPTESLAFFRLFSAAFKLSEGQWRDAVIDVSRQDCHVANLTVVAAQGIARRTMDRVVTGSNPSKIVASMWSSKLETGDIF